MAHARQSNLTGQSLMVAAMAYRVKYRKVDNAGKALKVRVGVEGMGVHKHNRGGLYPAGVRCKSLCETVLDAGFLKDEFTHALITVEEVPADAVLHLGHGAKFVSSSSYNAEKVPTTNSCANDELLSACFQSPYEHVRVTLLSHSHMMLILRAFLQQAQWDIPANAEKNMTFCDPDGKLSTTAVAESPNGKELGEVMQEGVMVEVLGWRMDVEEPGAAAIIS